MDRNFKSNQPNQAYVGDITYIPTQEGWLFKTREEAKQAIFEYIEVFYNRLRIHSSNGYLSPIDFEQLQKAA